MRFAGALLAASLLTGCLLLTTHDDPWPCNDDSDCSNGYVCRSFMAAQVCAPEGPGYCLSDDDCPYNPLYPGTIRCVNRLCGCETNADCKTLYELNGQVVQLAVCSNLQCTAAPCSADAQCGTLRCEGGACATSCSSDVDCQAPYYCSDGACYPRTTCLAGTQSCAPYSCGPDGYCPTTCTQDSNCSAGAACTNGACEALGCIIGAPGQCGGFACQYNTCDTRCSTNAACDTGLTCTASGCR